MSSKKRTATKEQRLQRPRQPNAAAEGPKRVVTVRRQGEAAEQDRVLRAMEPAIERAVENALKDGLFALGAASGEELTALREDLAEAHAALYDISNYALLASNSSGSLRRRFEELTASIGTRIDAVTFTDPALRTRMIEHARGSSAAAARGDTGVATEPWTEEDDILDVLSEPDDRTGALLAAITDNYDEDDFDPEYEAPRRRGRSR